MTGTVDLETSHHSHVTDFLFEMMYCLNASVFVSHLPMWVAIPRREETVAYPFQKGPQLCLAQVKSTVYYTVQQQFCNDFSTDAA